MLSELVDDYIKNKNVVVTSAADNGATTLSLFILNCLLKEDKFIVIYNPLNNIEKEFVKRYYPRVFNDTLFVTSKVTDFLSLLQYLRYKLDYLVIDPGDCLLYNPGLLPEISKLLIGNIICTSQIRQDPNKGGQIYSTLENKYMTTLFDYSIWIRNVTETSGIMKRKYIDIFKEKRSGNNYIARYVANFTDEGNIIQ